MAYEGKGETYACICSEHRSSRKASVNGAAKGR